MQPPNNQYQPQSFYPAPPPQKPKRKIKWWGWVIIGVVALVAFYTVMPKEQTPAQVAQNATATAAAVPTPKPTQTPIPSPTAAPTATAVPTPTPIPIVAINGFAVLKVGVIIREAPDKNAKAIGDTGNGGVVAWQNKTADDEWYERQGGGWVPKDTFQNYATQEEALAAVNAETAAITATALKQQQSTATAQAKLASYVSTAPEGTFTNAAGGITVSCNIKYLRSIGYFNANADSKFIAFNIRVTNNSGKALSVNPLYFQLVSTDGGVLSIDSNTFGLGGAMQAVDLPNNTYNDGAIAFLTTKQFIPGKLIFKGFTGAVTVTIVE